MVVVVNPLVAACAEASGFIGRVECAVHRARLATPQKSNGRLLYPQADRTDELVAGHVVVVVVVASDGSLF